MIPTGKVSGVELVGSTEETDESLGQGREVVVRVRVTTCAPSDGLHINIIITILVAAFFFLLTSTSGTW